MAFPYEEVFLALLVIYAIYSQWARLDSRYPVAAALVLLVVTAAVDAAGASAVANTLAVYVFFLLTAGVLLLLVDHVRAGRGRPRELPAAEAPTPLPDTPHQPERSAEHPFGDLQEQPVATVDAPGQQDQRDEQHGDP